VSEPESPADNSADDATVGAWLDVDPPPDVDPTAIVRDPVESPSLWDRIKRALAAKS
jgi:hypothetical protein